MGRNQVGGRGGENKNFFFLGLVFLGKQECAKQEELEVQEALFLCCIGIGSRMELWLR